MSKRDFLSLLDFTQAELHDLLERAKAYRKMHERGPYLGGGLTHDGTSRVDVNTGVHRWNASRVNWAVVALVPLPS